MILIRKLSIIKSTLLLPASGLFCRQSEQPVLPNQLVLYQNYPNPFNPTTTVAYILPRTEFVTIDIHDMNGQKIATLLQKCMPAGKHEIEFSGRNLASGIYLYKIEAGGWQEIRKMVLLK